jgi:hypothetical protein
MFAALAITGPKARSPEQTIGNTGKLAGEAAKDFENDGLRFLTFLSKRFKIEH